MSLTLLPCPNCSQNIQCEFDILDADSVNLPNYCPLCGAKFHAEGAGTMPTEPMDLLARGIERMKQGNTEGALQDLDAAIDLNTELVDAYLWRANLLGSAGYYDESSNDCDTALRLEPNNARACFIRASNNRALGSFDDLQAALVDYDKAITNAIKSNDTVYEELSLVDQAATYSDLGEQDKAINNCDRAIKLLPSDAKAFLNRGVARLRSGNVTAAISDFDEAIGLDRGYATAYYNRGKAYEMLANATLGQRLKRLLGVQSPELKQATSDLEKAQTLWGHRTETGNK